MRIYHYTSIETLALILRNKTMRFTRLDKVDDPDEYSFERHGHNPARYVYVSCWTRNANESIPQWVMYGNRRHGVRISFDEDMFQLKTDAIYPRWFETEELRDKDFMVMPILNDRIMSDINYVDNPQSYIDNIFVNINGDTAINFNNVGLYKSKDWVFQNECRFIMQAFPKNAQGRMYQPSYYIEENICCAQANIDVPIKPSAFDNMQIVLGPDVTLAERTIVEALCKAYLGHTNVQASVFTQ